MPSRPTEEWLTQNSKIHFPFRPGDYTPDVRALFLDARITLNHTRDSSLSLRMTSFALPSNDPAQATIQISYTGGGVLFDSTSPAITVVATDMGSPWTHLFWDFGGEYVQLVINRDITSSYAFPLLGLPADFVSGRVDVQVNKLRKIVVRDLKTGVVRGTIDRTPFEIKAGYNIQLANSTVPPTASTPDTRGITTLSLDAIPGAGEGRFVDCSTNQPLFSINGITADLRGEFYFDGKGCTWVSLPGSLDTNGKFALVASTIQFHQGCNPCCTCDEYDAVYTLLSSIWDQLSSTATRFAAIRAAYMTIYDQWAARLAGCDQIISDLNLTVRPGKTIGVQLLVQNARNCSMTGISINPVTVQVTTGPTATPTFVTDTGLIFTGDSKTKNWDPTTTYSDPAFVLEPGDFIMFSAEFYLQGAGPAASVLTAITGLLDTRSLTATASATTASPFNK